MLLLLITPNGSQPPRMDEVQLEATSLQQPPRITRRDPEEDPEEEPFGSVPYANVPLQSRHHSNTFPCIS